MELLLALQLLAFQHEGGVAFKLPTAESAWIVVDDVAGTCSVATERSSDANGSILVKGTTEAFYSAWGVIYQRSAPDASWTAHTRGTWIADHEPELGWSRALVRDGDIIPKPHLMYWQGASLVVANDPRYGGNRYYPDARFKLVWFAFESGACTVHHETSRKYGEPNLQAVALDGLTLGNGRAEQDGHRIPGDWAR